MQIIAFSKWDEVVPHAESWDRLARGVPFRSWAWLSTWWRHFGPASPDDAHMRLMVLGVLDSSGRLAGIAPWCLRRSAAKGWVLGWLGGGEVCSEYASVLCMPHDADCVTEALAAYLTGPNCAAGARHGWDLFEIDGVDAEDPAICRLLRQLGERGCTRHENSPQCTWRLTLPSSWEEFLGMVSKGHRKKLHRAEREFFATGRAAMRRVENCQQLPPAMDALIDLHQKRRQHMGEPGCFASPRFTAFHREVARELLLAGQLQLQLLELDGQIVAAEYQMASQGVTYVYQAGIDPTRLAEEPGHLITAATVKRAIDQGGRVVDFLRGNEPYKAHFRAVPRPMLTVPHRAGSHDVAPAEQPLAGRPRRETLADANTRKQRAASGSSRA